MQLAPYASEKLQKRLALVGKIFASTKLLRAGASELSVASKLRLTVRYVAMSGLAAQMQEGMPPLLRPRPVRSFVRTQADRPLRARSNRLVRGAKVYFPSNAIIGSDPPDSIPYCR
jgi:hypothetical protein